MAKKKAKQNKDNGLGVKEKVGRDEFVALEKRLAVLEKKVSHNIRR